MNKLKLAGALLAVLGSAWVGYKLAPVPEAKETIVYQEREVVKDRIVNRDVVRTETRPDGTKIVTTENESIAEHTDEREKVTTKTTVAVSSYQPKYSLGISLRPESIFSFKGVYEVEMGKRLWNSPLWVNFSANTKKELTVGIRVEF